MAPLRFARFCTAALLALTVVAGGTACGSDKAAACTSGLDLAGYTPDLSDPPSAVTEARRRAGELRALADRTSDADVQRELRGAADSLEALRESDVNPVSAVEWAGRQAERVERLRQACT